MFKLSLAFVLSHATANLENTWRVDIGQALYPEGIAYDSATKRVILSSLTSPVLVTFDASNDMKHLATYTRSDANDASCFGLALDPYTPNRVWCAAANLGTFDDGKLSAYDLQPSDTPNVTLSAVSNANFPCANENGTSCGVANDVVFGDDGIAYVTDTGLGKVYRVDQNNAIEEVASDPLLVSVDPPFGANGILFHSSNSLIVGNYGGATLNRVDLDTREVSAIEMEALPSNPDGLLFLNDGRMVVVTATELLILSTSNDWKQATIEETIDIDHSEDGESATTAALGSFEGEIFVTYVRFDDLFGEAGPNTNPSLIGRVVLENKGQPTSHPICKRK